MVSFASRTEQTLSRAVKSGHIDGIAKDAMLRSKFWTGLKSKLDLNLSCAMDFRNLISMVTWCIS